MSATSLSHGWGVSLILRDVIITFWEVIITFWDVIITFWEVIITVWASLSPLGRHYHRFDLSLTEGVGEMITTTGARRTDVTVLIRRVA